MKKILLLLISIISVSLSASAQWVELDSVNNVQSLTVTGNYLFTTRSYTTNPFIRIDLTNNTKTVMLNTFGAPFSYYGWKPMASVDSNVFYMDSDTLFASNDYGATWFKPAVNRMTGMYFFVHQDTFFVGYSRNIMRTVNGGQSFQNVFYESYWTSTTLHPLLVKGSDLYFTEEGGLMKTPHGGVSSWTPSINTRPNFPFTMVQIGDTLLGSDHDTLFRSVNGGATWSFRSVLTGANWINKMYMENGILYVGAGNGMQVSYDYGRNFIPINSGLPAPTYVSDFAVDSLNIYIGTGEGTYVRPKSEFIPKRIQGRVFYDANNNYLQDSLEPGLANAILYGSYSGRVFFTDSAGNYDAWFSEPDTLFYASPASYFNAVPVSFEVNAYGQTGDFAIQIDSTVQDLHVNVTAYTNSRIGGQTSFALNCTNSGAGHVNANLRVMLDTSFQVVAVDTPAAGFLGDSVYWNVTIAPFSSVRLRVDAQLPVDTSLNGDLLMLVAYAGPDSLDDTPFDNSDTLMQPVVAAYDPNEKVVFPAGDFDSTFINAGDYLSYVIRFQNTGNSYAADITVRDQLSALLDATTLVFEGSSHPCTMTIDTVNMLSFRLPNINLTWSSFDEPGSHGFVRFRIRPKASMTAGMQIENTAVIYFDYNSPIYTDTTISRYVLSTFLEEHETASAYPVVYPNPATDEVQITLKKGEQVELLAITGQVLHRNRAEADGTCRIPLAQIKPGVYLVRISGSNGMRCAKVIRGK